MHMSEVEHVLLSELLEWYRLQRHDFLNHWQVIMGNLQLNQPEKALAYMREMIAEPQEEQKIAQIPEPQLAASLLGFLIRLRREDITATIDFPEGMKQEDFWQDHWREEYGEALYGYTRECLELSAQFRQLGKLDAEVFLYDEPGGLSCQFILLDEENVLLDKMAKFIINPK
ncbi:Spo0B domain-containing protein [Desulfosporosinus sp. OT]|uniref:Spo0B domain-containing protein n=1 Tax=Desulfosporosinus sp. OT TaxID=913865 RepID=UPI00058DC90D|nr:Spo0B domain-containing protein [Desulfosporosinus sp. OT]